MASITDQPRRSRHASRWEVVLRPSKRERLEMELQSIEKYLDIADLPADRRSTLEARKEEVLKTLANLSF